MLLLITILDADEYCIGYTQVTGHQGDAATTPTDWRWGAKGPTKIVCYCNCAQYEKVHRKCLGCNHINLPIDMKIQQTPQVLPNNKK